MTIKVHPFDSQRSTPTFALAIISWRTGYCYINYDYSYMVAITFAAHVFRYHNINVLQEDLWSLKLK